MLKLTIISAGVNNQGIRKKRISKARARLSTAFIVFLFSSLVIFFLLFDFLASLVVLFSFLSFFFLSELAFESTTTKKKGKVSKWRCIYFGYEKGANNNFCTFYLF